MPYYPFIVFFMASFPYFTVCIVFFSFQKNYIFIQFFISVWGGLHYTVLLFPTIFIILFFVGGIFPDILVMTEVTIIKSY